MSTYKVLVSNLNKEAAKSSQKFHEYMSLFTSITIPQHTSAKWIPVMEDIKQNSIAVFAHSKRGIRALGHIFTDPKKNKLVFKRVWFHHKTGKLNVDRVSRKSLEAYTCRRGFWVVLAESIDLNLTIADVDDPCKINVLRECYEKYVAGMDESPIKGSVPIKGYEQFKIGEYPTPAWANSVTLKIEQKELKLKKKTGDPNKKNHSKKRAHSTSSTNDDSSEDIDIEEVEANPSHYIIVRSGIEKYPEPCMNVKIYPDIVPCNTTLETLEQVIPALIDADEYVLVDNGFNSL